MYCWPRLLVKIDPKRSFFTFGPPPSGQKYVEGCLWASPGLLLGCSWLRLGCSWLLLGCSWAAPGCSWVALAFSWAAPRLLLGWSWAAPGCSWTAPGCCWLLVAAPGLLLGSFPKSMSNLPQQTTYASLGSCGGVFVWWYLHDAVSDG